MIIYLHGFASSSYSSKAQKFKEYFSKLDRFVSPNLTHIPKLAVYNAEELIKIFLAENKEEVILMGSSLGGYYASYLANKYNLKAVLINPSVYPFETLKKFSQSDCRSYFDNSAFEFTQEHAESLYDYQVQTYRDIKKFLVCLQTGDEVLDYREAEQKLSGAEFIIDKGGDHSFLDIEKHFEKIEKFLFN